MSHLFILINLNFTYANIISHGKVFFFLVRKEFFCYAYKLMRTNYRKLKPDYSLSVITLFGLKIESSDFHFYN